jgi:hypothetical protein
MESLLSVVGVKAGVGFRYFGFGLGGLMPYFNQDYNHDRPHDSLKNMTPIEFLRDMKT